MPCATARWLCPLNEAATVRFTQHSQSHLVTQSLPLLLPFNAKAPYLHIVSVFYHRELYALVKMAKLLYIWPFFGIIDHTEDKNIV